MPRDLKVINLGIEPYKTIWDYQYRLFDLRLKNQISDVLILLEHNHVFTLGKTAKLEHLLLNPRQLKDEGIELFEIDRGGDITYHGPGQIVGYPIIKLDELYKDLHKYLRNLEEVIIQTLGEFNVEGYRIPGLTGVWVNDEKIAAIGIKVSRWITMHGFAFNVNTVLDYFQKIIPCGIKDKGVTSLQKILNRKISIDDVKQILIQKFMQVFNYEIFEEYISIEKYIGDTLEKITEGV